MSLTMGIVAMVEKSLREGHVESIDGGGLQRREYPYPHS